MDKYIFKMKLELPATVQAGSSVPGVFSLTNAGTTDHRVLTWNTPLEGLISPECFKVTTGGKTIRYDGKLVSRKLVPPADAYVLVRAGATVTAQFDLSEAYFIEALGKYDVEVTCKITALGIESPLSLAEKVSTSFEVVGQQVSGKPTEGMRARALKGKAPGAALVGAAQAPTISGGTSAQQTTLGQAWINGYAFQKRAISALATSRFDTIFASTFQVPANAANKTTASGYYTSMKTGMETSTFTLTINPTQDGGAIAYTYMNSTQIWFNPSYFTDFGPIKGDFSQASLMVHELSHAVCSIPDCSDALACSYNLQYFSARVFMEYHLTLPQGTISVRNGIFQGSQTNVIWSPCNPNEMGGWMDGDELNVVCTFNLNPPITPLPGSGEYAGLCVGACSDQDTTGITQLITEAQQIYVPNVGQLLGTSSGQQITTNATPASGNIFYNAQSTSGDFPLTPSTRGTLSNYIYKWVMFYNGSNTVVPSGSNVEIVFGYGDPMWSESDS